MDIPQSWQELSALAERIVASLGSLSVPGLRVVDGLLLLSALLLLVITMVLLRQRRRMRHTEQARNNAEALASCLFDALPDAATITDPEGRFLSVNPAFAQLVGREEREIAGAMLTDLFTPAVAERFQYRPVEGEEDEFHETFRIRADHPSRFLAHKTPLFDTQGLLIGVLTQLSPAKEPTFLTRPIKSRQKRGRRPAGTQATAVNIDIRAAGEGTGSQEQLPKLDEHSDSQVRSTEAAGTGLRTPKQDTEHREPEASGKFPQGPDNPMDSTAPDTVPNLVEALQIAVKITGKTDKERSSGGQTATTGAEAAEGNEKPLPLASFQFQLPPKDDPKERALRGLGKR